MRYSWVRYSGVLLYLQNFRAFVSSFKTSQNVDQNLIFKIFFVSGYLTVEEVRPVIQSYSEIYNLSLTTTKIESCLEQCSNGRHVDFETLLHMLSVA